MFVLNLKCKKKGKRQKKLYKKMYVGVLEEAFVILCLTSDFITNAS